MRRLCILLFILGTKELPLLAMTPWSLFEDFSQVGQYGSLSNWDQVNDSTNLDSWPDFKVGNQTIFNNSLSFLANDEQEQNGLIYLNKPQGSKEWFIWPTQPVQWTISFKVNLNSDFVASGTNGIVEGGLLIRNFWSNGYPWGPSGQYYLPKQGYWTAFGIDASGRKYLATDMFGTGTSSDYYYDSSISSSELYIKVVFNSDLLSLSSYYTEDLVNPGYYWSNPFRTESINAWGDNSGFIKQSPEDYLKVLNIGLGGYSNNTTVPDGTVTIDDFSFNLVPEPSALSLLAVGLGGLALLRRGRKED